MLFLHLTSQHVSLSSMLRQIELSVIVWHIFNNFGHAVNYYVSVLKRLTTTKVLCKINLYEQQPVAVIGRVVCQ